MKIKFLFLAFFMTINLSTILAQNSDQGAGGSGGKGTDISQRSAEGSNQKIINYVEIINNVNQEIDTISIDEITYYVQHLAPGKYTAVYFNNEGYIVDRTEFAIE